jgi:hypothetical protein
MENAQEIIEGKFTVWTISTSALRFKARLKAQDLNISEGDIDDNISLGSKDMISQKDRVYLSQSTGQVQGFMRYVSRRFFGRGLYMVPESKVLATLEGLKKIRASQQERVEEFIKRYPQEKEEQARKHPNLENETWPTPEQMREYFSVSWKVFQLQAVGIKDTDPEELAQAKQEFQQELKQGYEELKKEILGQAYQDMLNSIDAIQDKIKNGEKLLETNLKKPRQIIDQYLQIASVFDLPQVIEKVEELKSTLDGTNAKELRESPYYTKQFSESIKTLSKDLETVTGYGRDGRMKRVLDLSPEPTAPQDCQPSPSPAPQTNGKPAPRPNEPRLF